jgi:hypothetical protein
LTTALFVPVLLGSHEWALSRLLACAAVAILSVLAGQILIRMVRVPEHASYGGPFVLVGGFSFASLMHLAITATFRVDAGMALVADALLLAVLAWVVRRRTPWNIEAIRFSWLDLWVLLGVSLVVTVWTREALGAVREAQSTGIFRVWNDFLLQATEIQYLQHYGTFAGQSPYLAGTTQPFYHRASYALSALYGWISRDDPLQTATYFWLPAGVILLGTSAYGLGTAIGGRAAGLIVVAALLLLPDASMYGLRNGYFAFHWLMQVAPGSGYAVALVLVALALYVSSIRSGRSGLLIWAFALAGVSALFRVHIALPAIAMFVVLGYAAWLPSHPRYRLAVLLGMLIVAAVVVVGSEHIALAPHLLSGQRDGVVYVDAVHLAVPTAYEGFYPTFVVGYDDLQKMLVGYPLLLLAELGAFLFVLPLLTLLRWRAGVSSWQIDCVPYVLLVIHACITFLLPTPANGDITEWSHRSFVLVYAVVVVLSMAWIVELYDRSVLDPAVKKRVAFLLVPLALTGLVTPWNFGKNAQYGSLRDGPSACATPISHDLFEATRFIRDHARPGDRVQASDSDPIALIVSLTGLQAYVSRLPLYEKIGASQGQLANSRAHANQALVGARDYADLVAFGQKSGVRWYVLNTPDMPMWPPSLLERAAFASGKLRVFDLHRQ